MYPDDQQQRPNNNAMGQAPAPFVLGQPDDPNKPKEKPKRNLPWLPWAISGFLLFLVIIFGIVFALNSGNKDKETPTVTDTNKTTEEEQKTATGCTSKERRYQNEDLDIRFCYPSSWGDVKVADGKFDPSDNGTRVTLSFADKSPVHLGLVSDDWSSDSAKVETCADPAVQAFPTTNTFSAKWLTDGSGKIVNSATRGLEVIADEYLLQERVNNTSTNGVCLEGFKAFNGEVYRNAKATYYTTFSDKIATPALHINDPKVLVPVTDRTEFTAFVKSIEKF